MRRDRSQVMQAESSEAPLVQRIALVAGARDVVPTRSGGTARR
jgi:hypothetical protein